jgi:signal transduction histidine kinase
VCRRVLVETAIRLTAPPVETARLSIEAKRHGFSLELPPDPIRFAADPLRLAQAFSNLCIRDVCASEQLASTVCHAGHVT